MIDTTILISVYNGLHFLPDAVDSVLNQSYRNYIFLIINDGSTDQTAKYLESLKDPRIKIINHEKNEGLTKRLGEGLNLTRTKFLARMDADDIALPDRLSNQRQFLISHPEFAAVGCNFQKIDENENKIGQSDFPTSYEDIKKEIYKKNPFSHSCLFFQTEKLKKAGGYNLNFRYSQDYELMLRLAAFFPVANLKEVYLWDRDNENSISHKRSFSQAWCFLQAQILGLTRYNYPKSNVVHLIKTTAYLIKSSV